MADPAARDGGDGQHGGGRILDRGDVREQDLLERGRQSRALGSVAPGREQLLGEERVAVRPVEDFADEVVARRRALDRGEDGRELDLDRSG